MTPVVPPRQSSLVEMRRSEGPAPTTHSDADYLREVLLLEDGRTEELCDVDLTKEAEALGIAIPRPPSPRNTAHDSLCESAITVASHHARTTSSASRGSDSTGMTSRSSLDHAAPPQMRKRSNPRRSLSFSEYDKFVMQTEARDAANLDFSPPPVPAEPAPSLFSVSTRRSYASIRKGIKSRLRLRKTKTSEEATPSCICCREDSEKTRPVHTLPCQHSYCDACLRVLISQASTDESKMPPRCCSRAIPASVIKSLLSREDQHNFMKSVLQFSTPWSQRIFCTNPACGEFIPKRDKIDPKHPFEVVCRKCRTRVCSTCKSAAHALGQACPADWELDAVLQMGGNTGWRRCYKCRDLVELTQERSHITCRCKAQFCYICGAVWDSVIGCPNFCNGEEELERRRLEEEARIAELEAERLAKEEEEQQEAAEKLAAEKRTLESEQLNTLRTRHINERDRFCAFERKVKRDMWTRQAQVRLDTLGRHSELQTKMKERHLGTAAHLEDRQVGAEMELRATLKQSERSVHIRLRHMEAYCDGLGRSANGSNPARVVTERDLRELGQQYNLRDDMERLHQSKINVMRDKQAKQMELLLSRQEEELKRLTAKHAEELRILELSFATEDEDFVKLFSERRRRLTSRWYLAEEIERKKLEIRTNLRFAPMAAIEWPPPAPEMEEQLHVVSEDD